MAREPAITFRGALRILGHYDRPWLDRLDRLLGGVILASGLTPVSALWGWVDQKNEATGLLRRALDAVSGRLTKTGGLARHELVVAAHTTLVLAAFFETLRVQLAAAYEGASLTEAEKVMLGTGTWQREGDSLVRHLYAAQVPSPSAARGFEENAAFVGQWAEDRMGLVGRFLKGIGLNIRVDAPEAAFAKAVSERYRSDYLTLATTVSEFKVWGNLTEHAATRSALAGLADLLTHLPHAPQRDLRALLAEANQAELTRPVIDVYVDGYGIDAVFPTVEDVFITPHFKSARATRRTRIGDEHWWEENFESRQDLDVVLARHFSSPDVTRLPLLLLGHPGSGTSLLTMVLAARLPASTYTVVRVPLRRVGADAHVSAQIQQALAIATNDRVLWPELADQSEDTIRVIILDGLDELLQATSNDRGGYLTDIVEFQRIEAAMGRPVAVVVTSRTLVADRVRVPEGTSVVKLEDFDDHQIREWIRVWNEGNSGTGTRPVTPELAMVHANLARQPLLLLMLTLYFADPNTELPNEDMSTSDLYGRLFDTYARREVTKQAGRVLSEDRLADDARTQLDRLSTAALGMFNRGRQSITEAELSADLSGLGEAAPVGGRLLGEFFFVHASEANLGSSRGYEFLHATFGEYLVATRVVEVLVEAAEGAFGLRRPREPDDEKLFALLSYEPLAIQRPTLDFLAEQFAVMDEQDLERVLRTLDLLIPAHRNRRLETRHRDYRPQPSDAIRAVAAYSANLVLLRVLADPSGVRLTKLWRQSDAVVAWRAVVNLWAAGLDAEGYRAMLSAVVRRDDTVAFRKFSLGDLSEFDDFDAARLRWDRGAELRLRFGHALFGELIFDEAGDPHSWGDAALSSLVSMVMGLPTDWHQPDAPESVPWEQKTLIAEVAYRVLGVHCVRWDRRVTESFLRWLLCLSAPGAFSPRPLVLVEHVHPGLLEILLASPDDDWTPEWCERLRAVTANSVKDTDIDYVAGYLVQEAPDRWPILDIEFR